mgnify:CR=1 FL=1
MLDSKTNKVFFSACFTQTYRKCKKSIMEALKAKGIAADRITVAYKGDTVQPYNTPEENRVSICIAE